MWQNNTDGGILFMAWIKYKENCVVNSDRILDIRIISTKVYPKGNLEWAINFHDCGGYQSTIGSFDSKEDCEQVFNYIVEAIGTKSYIDLTKGLPNLNEHILMTEKYLLDKGFTSCQYTKMGYTEYVSPNKQIIVHHGARVSNKPSCSWHVHVSNVYTDPIGTLDFEYLEEFETFLKLCGVDYGEK